MKGGLIKRKGIDIFSLSFLDIIACGFGAIVLLLLISRSASVTEEPEPTSSPDMSALFSAMDETEQLQDEIDDLQTKLTLSSTAVSEAQSELAQAISMRDSAQSRQDITKRVLDGMEVAKQSLTEEMRRMLDQDEQDEDVGGIPVDSEYVIFIVDTSGSMKQVWNRVIEQIKNVLDIHPTVKGFQIMNDQGQYLFGSYRREWIPDTPTMRSGALDLMRAWSDFSNSDPVQGIRAAIQTFYDPDKKISIFVFGDEFSGESVEQTVRMIESINKPDASGQTRVQIHAVGFLSEYSLAAGTGGRYAHLMREVTSRNNGTFVAISQQAMPLPIRPSSGRVILQDRN